MVSWSRLKEPEITYRIYLKQVHESDSVCEGSERPEAEDSEAGAAVQRERKCPEVKRLPTFSSVHLVDE